MANSIDKLDAAISEQLSAGGAVSSMTKDQFLDFIDIVTGGVKNNLSFFTDMAGIEKEMQAWLKANIRGNMKSIVYYNAISKDLVYNAKKVMDERFMGAIVDTLASYATILDEVSKNVDNIFQNKSINLFNVKVSHIAVFGITADAEVFCKFVAWYIDLFMSDFVHDLSGLAPYQTKYLEAAVKVVPGIMNRMLNNRMKGSFVSGVLNYKSGGSDVLLVNSDNKSNAKFAKIANGVSEADIEAGARGFSCFKKIGDWWVSWRDDKMRRLRSERELMQARVQLLKLQLDNVDPESSEYKKQIKIIENYMAIIIRLDQKLDKYYNN